MPGSVYCSFLQHPVWQPKPVELQENTIYIWRAEKKNLARSYNDCLALLNDQERLAAAKYYHQSDNQRYVLQHGLLRQLLCDYLNIANADILYNYNQSKKPYLAGVNHKICYFNLSHSADDFLIAIGDKELGIDLEQIKPGFHYHAIASQYFSTAEVDFINQAPDPTEAFFLLWTRKEALLKACGTGIDDNLPLMPALDGSYPLPGAYPDQQWLTESFRVDNYMASITYPAPQTAVKLLTINGG